MRCCIAQIYCLHVILNNSISLANCKRYAINAKNIAAVANAASAEEYVPGRVLALCRSSGATAIKNVYIINRHAFDD